MRKLSKIGLTVLAGAGVFLIAAAIGPDTFRVERSRQIAAPPELVYAQINDLTRMKSWNPYERKDPSLKGEFGARSEGIGASYYWDSETMATGCMTIVESKPDSLVSLRLEFEKPFKSTFTTDYVLRSTGGGTEVTWAMHGPANFVHKLMQTAFILDLLIGRDLEDGLRNLGAQVEAH